MSRSGYNDSCLDDTWGYIRWRGAVTSALRGKKGQAFLCETLAALDAIPDKRLVKEELEDKGDVCTLGAVGKARGLDLGALDPEDREAVAGTFGIPFSLACEIMFENDEGTCIEETPERRWSRMRQWVASEIIPTDSR